MTIAEQLERAAEIEARLTSDVVTLLHSHSHERGLVAVSCAAAYLCRSDAELDELIESIRDFKRRIDARPRPAA
jgi:hypothetical protein